MREHIKADEPFAREDVTAGEALERFAREGQDYKVELIEDLVRERGRRHRLASTRTARSPTSAAARTRRHRAHQGVQAAVRRRRLLARRRQPPDAHPHLRHRVLHARRTSTRTSSGSSRPARATTASSAGARPVHVLRVSPGSPFWLPNGMASGTSSSALARARTARAATARSRRRSSTTSSCGSSPATGTSTARTCTSPRSRTARWASSR